MSRYFTLALKLGINLFQVTFFNGYSFRTLKDTLQHSVSQQVSQKGLTESHEFSVKFYSRW